MTLFEEFCYQNSSSIRKSITLMFMSSSRSKFTLFIAKLGNRCFCWFPSAMLELIRMISSMALSTQSSINLGKTFPQISRIRIVPSTQILARVFVYLPPFISQILDFIYRMVLIFILIYFEWRDTENQQYLLSIIVVKDFPSILIAYVNSLSLKFE